MAYRDYLLPLILALCVAGAAAGNGARSIQRIPLARRAAASSPMAGLLGGIWPAEANDGEGVVPLLNYLDAQVRRLPAGPRAHRGRSEFRSAGA